MNNIHSLLSRWELNQIRATLLKKHKKVFLRKNAARGTGERIFQKNNKYHLKKYLVHVTCLKCRFVEQQIDSKDDIRGIYTTHETNLKSEESFLPCNW